MQAETKRRHGTAGVLWVLLALALWLSGTVPARAQVRPATKPIVSSRLQRIVDMIPDAALGLPPYLAKPQDVYLLVTAGAAYTDIQVLANPEVPAPTVARALSSALAGTTLQGRTVEWSADRYSAAQVSEDHHRFGALRGSNVVPLAPLMVGLRRAGLTPHLLLRVPRYAQASLPVPPYSTKTFLWYDAGHLAGQAGVAVAATLSPLSLALPLLCFLLFPFIGFLGLWLAGLLSSRGRKDIAARRQLFRSVNALALPTAFLAQLAGVYALFHLPVVPALADLWFGSSSTTVLVPFLLISALPIMLFLGIPHRQETRRFGPVAVGPATPIPMSDEENAVRERAARYSRVPHIIGAVILAVALLAVPRRSPLYSLVHPVAVMLPALAGLLSSKLFSKRLGKFTQKTLDDDLTWRARQLGQTLGVRMPDVFVEDSSRAAHLAFASHQGHHITLSRKLQAAFTAAETDFVLAHHLACMKRRTGISSNSLMLGFVLPLPMFLFTAFVLLPHFIPGGATSATVFASPWFLPSMFTYLILCGVFLMALITSATKRQAKQETDADRDALEATGELAAAEGALDKLGVDAALTPEALAAAQFSGSFGGKAGNNVAQLAAGRLLLRRAALQQTAQTLRFTPSAKPAEADLSPFSPAGTDKR